MRDSHAGFYAPVDPAGSETHARWGVRLEPDRRRSQPRRVGHPSRSGLAGTRPVIASSSARLDVPCPQWAPRSRGFGRPSSSTSPSGRCRRRRSSEDPPRMRHDRRIAPRLDRTMPSAAIHPVVGRSGRLRPVRKRCRFRTKRSPPAATRASAPCRTEAAPPRRATSRDRDRSRVPCPRPRRRPRRGPSRSEPRAWG
jgi:hypothetical protein